MSPRLRSPVFVACLLLLGGCTPDASPTRPADPLLSMTEPSDPATQVFAAVVPGGDHTCGITSDAQAYCWGQNFFGEIGDGTTTHRILPTAVAGGLSFVELTTATSHTCGLTEDGAAYCWGRNHLGQLGDGTTVDRPVPTPVSGGHDFASISAGRSMTCALTTSGDAYCWGNNELGGLGDGTTTDRHVPTPVTGGLAFTAISAASVANHACALDSGGAAYCWGNNLFGALGDGTTTNRPTPAPVSGELRFESIDAGLWFTCAVEVGGAAYCWGSNEAALGDGTNVHRHVPTLVSGGLTFATIAAGELLACGLDVDGNGYCWGDNEFGGVGDGTTILRLVPTPVSGGITFSSIALGAGQTCGLDLQGGTYCWGANTFGQLGDGTTTDRLTPTPVRSLSAPNRDIKTERVTDLRVESATSSTLTLYWTQVSDGLGDPAWYRVKYASPTIGDWKSATVGCHRTIRGDEIGKEISCTISGLDPDTRYEIQLMSYRLVDGKWEGAVYSTSARGTTFAADVATTVDDLEVTAATASTLTVRWTQVNDGTGAPASYRVRYGSPLLVWSDGTIGCRRTIWGTEIGAELSCTIQGLEPGTAYDVQLYSFYFRDGRWAAAHRSNLVSATTPTS